MGIDKVSSNGNGAVQAYKENMLLNQNKKVQSQSEKEEKVKTEKSANENKSFEVTLTSKKLADSVVEKSAVHRSAEAKTDDVNRQDRLDELARQIKNGTFKVDSEAVANKMLEDKNLVKNLLY